MDVKVDTVSPELLILRKADPQPQRTGGGGREAADWRPWRGEVWREDWEAAAALDPEG